MFHRRPGLAVSLPAVGSGRFFSKQFRVRLDSVDRHAGFTRVAMAGVTAAAGLAIFGLAPFDLHTPLHHLGIMDPLCGMTRAVRAAARGEVRGAFGYNPGVFVLAAFASVVLVRLLVGKTTRRWFEIRIVRPRFIRAVTAVAVMALWGNQQLHASHLSS